MFKIGDNVIIKSINEKGVILECFPALGVYYVIKTNSSTFIVREDDVKIEKKQIKTNKINYNNGQGIMSWELINKNNLKVKVHSGRFNVTTFLKILISEVDRLKEFNYKRISPYKLYHESPTNREDKSHVYFIDFINIKDNNKIQRSGVIKLDCSMCLVEGEYNFFIPDLLEVAKSRGLVELEGDTYKIIESKFVDRPNIEYIDTSMSRENLVAKGWTVPSGYVEI